MMAVDSDRRRSSSLFEDTLTSLSEPKIDELSGLAARLFATPFAKISLVADGGEWLTSGGERDIKPSRDCGLCCWAMRIGHDVMVVPDTLADPRFVHDELVRSAPWIRFFAGAPLIMPDGEKVGVLWVADTRPRDRAAVEEGMLSTLASQVVTLLALRRANSLLAHRESELRSIIETSGEAIYGVNPRGCCTFVNPACLRLLGFERPEDLIGAEMHDVIHYAHANGEVYRKEDCTILAAFREGREIRLVEETFWRADGTPIWVIYTSSPLFRDGRLVGSVNSFVDVTEQRRTRQELVAAARVRDRFTSVLGHDLRNPLATVLMGSQLLARTATAETARAVAVRVTHAAERMDRLIRDLLDFIRVREGGALALVPRRANLLEIAHEIVGELELAHPGQRIELHTDGEPIGEWDPDRIAQVCSNLLANAIHHGAPQEPVRVSIGVDAEVATLTVENRGPPIPEAMRAHLFDPFRRGRAQSDGRDRGLGLGLFIVQQITRAHGGEIAFTSDGDGTSFVVRLPRRAAPRARSNEP